MDWIPGPLYRLTPEQYEALVDKGVFTARDRFRLINRFLVAKMPENNPHCTANDLCGAALDGLLPDGWYVRASKPVRLSV